MLHFKAKIVKKDFRILFQYLAKVVQKNGRLSVTVILLPCYITVVAAKPLSCVLYCYITVAVAVAVSLSDAIQLILFRQLLNPLPMKCAIFYSQSMFFLL